jgi:phosphatidylserine/phosphatidylglycerophosphate/cardiolipin synthase-like enzyme
LLLRVGVVISIASCDVSNEKQRAAKELVMPNQGKVVTFHNNDVVFLAWAFPESIAQCLGFSIRRRDLLKPAAPFMPLPAWVGWEGGNNADWQAKNTDVWPVQKFTWRDFTAKPGGSYQYQIVPMIGVPNALRPDESLIIVSDIVDVTPDAADNVDAYFNNGILSTQHISHLLPAGAKGAPNFTKLLGHIRTAGDGLRNELAGQMIDVLKSLLIRAQKEGGQCYCALYELDDAELIDALIKTKPNVHVILSAAGANDSTNKGSRAKLHEAGVDVTDRMFPASHIGHNKFIVYLEKPDRPVTVLTGSTNWTSTGLCAQSNNSVIINDRAIAGSYFEYWKRLKEDTVSAGDDTSALQSTDFRLNNNHPNMSGNTTVWFSPNTRQKTRPANDPSAPLDMKEAFALIGAAKQAVLFLEFQPGAPSVLDAIKAAEQNNTKLFVRGAATDPKAIEKFDDKQPITTELFHRSATGAPEVVFETGAVATAINDQFAYWKKELLKSSPTAHAIIHDKIVVIDPMSATDCIVMTGSHNQGYKASYANDENFLIFRGNQALALAYTTHVMDVYDHYRWRFLVQQQKAHAWTGLQTSPDWQDRYFQPGSMAYQEIAFWLSNPALTVPEASRKARPPGEVGAATQGRQPASPRPAERGERPRQ